MALLLQGSTFRTGTPVQSRNTQAIRQQRRNMTIRAAYNPQEGKVLDLDDMENSTGSWEMYGNEDNAVYPPLQEEFFERAGAPLASRKEALFAGTGLAATIAIALFGKGLQYKYKLPIIKGNPKYKAPSGASGVDKKIETAAKKFEGKE